MRTYKIPNIDKGTIIKGVMIPLRAIIENPIWNKQYKTLDMLSGKDLSITSISLVNRFIICPDDDDDLVDALSKKDIGAPNTVFNRFEWKNWLACNPTFKVENVLRKRNILIDTLHAINAGKYVWRLVKNDTAAVDDVDAMDNVLVHLDMSNCCKNCDPLTMKKDAIIAIK